MYVHDRSLLGTTAADVLDRVLDKGIVIDAWVRVSLVGIERITPSRGGRAVARAPDADELVHAARAPCSPGANRVSAPARLRAASAFIPW
jgi:hypothetical protein